MSDGRTCTTCRHGAVFYSPATGQVENCHHPMLIWTDPVYGDRKPTQCHVARGGRHACGPEGRLYEAPPPETQEQRRAWLLTMLLMALLMVAIVGPGIVYLLIQFAQVLHRAGVHP